MATFLLAAAVVTTTYGHVALEYPPGRTDNDYIFTFNGECDPTNSCASFCGDPYDNENNPITTLQVGTPITLRWFSPVPHPPYQYRLSLNKQTSDGNFDLPDNILTIVDAEDAAVSDSSSSNSRSREQYYSTQVVIPTEALQYCSGPDPCVLQLYDLYYFVSCANVLLTTDSDSVVPPSNTDMTNSIDDGLLDVTLPPSLESSDVPVIFVEAESFEDYRIIVDDMPPLRDPTITINRCESYEFVIDAPGHPFVIKTEPGIGWENLYDNGLPLSENQGLEVGTFDFIVDEDAPSKLFYQCTLHPEMVGEIEVIDSDSCLEDSSGTMELTGSYSLKVFGFIWVALIVHMQM